MLDLEELERKLDEALERETSESLKQWLFSKRQPKIEDILGAGQLVNLKGMACSIKGIEGSNVQLDNDNISAGEFNYAMAA